MRSFTSIEKSKKIKDFSLVLQYTFNQNNILILVVFEIAITFKTMSC